MTIYKNSSFTKSYLDKAGVVQIQNSVVVMQDLLPEENLQTSLRSLQTGMSSVCHGKHIEGTLLTHTCSRTNETPTDDSMLR